MYVVTTYIVVGGEDTLTPMVRRVVVAAAVLLGLSLLGAPAAGAAQQCPHRLGWVAISRWSTIMAEVAPWLLRVFLLLHAGVDPVVLRAGLLEHERFDVYRGNVAQMVADLGWPPPVPAGEETDTGSADPAN